MPHRARLRKVGGSVMLAIPPALLEALSLASDDTVGMDVKAGKLVVSPSRRRRYTLDELLAEAEANADEMWTTSPAAGREMI